jgi:hypothetical protein
MYEKKWCHFRLHVTETADSGRANPDSDGFVSLFLLPRPSCGLGWGKCLMDDSQRHCEAQGCQRITEISSRLLAGYGDEPNGFTYVKLI